MTYTSNPEDHGGEGSTAREMKLLVGRVRAAALKLFSVSTVVVFVINSIRAAWNSGVIYPGVLQATFCFAMHSIGFRGLFPNWEQQLLGKLPFISPPTHFVFFTQALLLLIN